MPPCLIQKIWKPQPEQPSLFTNKSWQICSSPAKFRTGPSSMTWEVWELLISPCLPSKAQVRRCLKITAVAYSKCLSSTLLEPSSSPGKSSLLSWTQSPSKKLRFLSPITIKQCSKLSILPKFNKNTEANNPTELPTGTFIDI